MVIKMNRSLGIVCDELHITNLEGVMHETVGNYSVEQWANFTKSEFNTHQSSLSLPEKQKLNQLLSECVNALPGKNLAGGLQ
jgi:hypothetical protein